MEKTRKLIWDRQALVKLEKSLQWISEVSIQQAELVEQAILEKVEEIHEHPERFPPDKYVINNKGNFYRAIETHSYRISYRYTEDRVLILRVRHVRQNPESM
jgi:plasmid stabilization system protein ParE